MEEDTLGLSPWWRAPRLVAAAACFLLGAVVLALGLAPRLMPAAAEPAPLAGDPLAEFSDGIAEEGDQSEAPGELIVYVTGAVHAPDVYRLPAGARVKDAVTAAGGLRPDAAGEQVNLAEALADAQHVHIPALTEIAAEPASAEGGRTTGGGLIDLNSASATELEELPGVGAVLAERIVARREESGPFGSVDELREVTGVGPKLFEQIAPLVSAGR